MINVDILRAYGVVVTLFKARYIIGVADKTLHELRIVGWERLSIDSHFLLVATTTPNFIAKFLLILATPDVPFYFVYLFHYFRNLLTTASTGFYSIISLVVDFLCPIFLINSAAFVAIRTNVADFPLISISLRKVFREQEKLGLTQMDQSFHAPGHVLTRAGVNDA
jgi:hypothetical protein